MGSNSINLIVRFFLEMIALVAIGMFGWMVGNGLLKYLFTFGLPIVAAVVWGVFAVPDDPSRSGKVPIPIPGKIRLIIEFLIFIFGVYSMYYIGYSTMGLIYGIALIIHYIVSYDRITWLIKK